MSDKMRKNINDTKASSPKRPLARPPIDPNARNKNEVVTNNKNLKVNDEYNLVGNDVHDHDIDSIDKSYSYTLEETHSIKKLSVTYPFEDSPNNISYATANKTCDTSSTIKKRTKAKDPTLLQSSDEINLESSDEINPEETDTFKCNINYILSAFIILVLLAIAYISNMPAQSNIEPNNKKNNCSFVNLKKSFPNQNDNLWQAMTIGIEGILNNDPATPGVYLFLHENNHLTNVLIENIVNTSSSCFDTNLQPIRLVTEDFNSKDYGTIIEKYKKNIKDGGVLIVANLNEIPPESAKALHAICDSYNPIVGRVIIFLTLTVHPDEQGKSLEIAENKLNHLWAATIQQNELDALISRVTESVLRLQ